MLIDRLRQLADVHHQVSLTIITRFISIINLNTQQIAHGAPPSHMSNLERQLRTHRELCVAVSLFCFFCRLIDWWFLKRRNTCLAFVCDRDGTSIAAGVCNVASYMCKKTLLSVIIHNHHRIKNPKGVVGREGSASRTSRIVTLRDAIFVIIIVDDQCYTDDDAEFNRCNSTNVWHNARLLHSRFWLLSLLFWKQDRLNWNPL